MNRVLVVDDEPNIRRLLDRILTSEQFEVHTAPDPETAQGLAREHQFDVALVDINLAEANGLDLSQSLVDNNPDLKTIVITGMPSVDNAAGAFRSGAFDFLTKPIDSDALIKTVSRAAELKRLSSEKRQLEKENDEYRQNLERLVRERTEELRRAEEKYRTLVETSNDIIYSCDRDGCFTYVNPAAQRITGFSREEVMGRSFLEFVREDYRNEVRRSVLDQYRRRTPVSTQEFPVVVKDDNEVWLTQTVQLVEEDSGDIRFQVQAHDSTARRHAEEALRESEERFRLLAENSKDIIWSMDENGRFTYVSPSVTEVAGYSPDEVLGRRVVDFFTPESAAMVKALIAGQRAKPMDRREAAIRIELQQYRKDRSILDIEVNATWVVDTAGEPIGLQGITRDISARKEAETAREIAHVRLQTIMDTARVGIVLIDSETKRIDQVNEEALRMFGRPAEDVVGQPCFDLLCDAAKRECPVTDQGERVKEIERTLRRNDGTELPVIKTVRSAEIAGTKYLIECLVDISERKSAEETLRNEMAERKRAEADARRAHTEIAHLLATIPTILIGFDADGRITAWNRMAEETFGMSAEQAVGQTCSDCRAELPCEDLRKHVDRCVDEKTSTRIEDMRYRRPDGKDGVLEVTLTPRTRKDGEVVGFLLLGADVTDRLLLERQLTTAQKLESIGQLAAGIAHEINTPTQYIGDNNRFLLEAFDDLKRLLTRYEELRQAAREGQATDAIIKDIEELIAEVDLEYLATEIPDAVRQSLDGVERVARIVRAMKEFSHPGASEKTPIDINSAIESTITVARNEWKYVAEMETDFDETLTQVPCLPSEFNQVVLNLLINAAHAIGDVVGDTGSKGTITVTTRADGQWADIRIADTGTGIKGGHRDKVFDPFFTTKEVGRGTGQGLSIAHSVVVEKLGGTIDFETEEGKGTTFIIRLPLDD